MGMWSFQKFYHRLSDENYIVDYETKTVHTLRNEQPECHLKDIKIKKFANDDVSYVLSGYKLCEWCYDY